ncbi:hypothetical protein ACWD04_10510 [Streptomyces sp. NPDC002911]
MRKRVFVSFDYDKTLKDFLSGQARNPDSPFEVHDGPIKEAPNGHKAQTGKKQATAKADGTAYRWTRPQLKTLAGGGR